MNILFLGDIVGSVGRECVREQLPRLKEQYEIDLVVANAENSAHGKGITRKIYHQLLAMGIDVCTMGNHTFSKNDIYQFIEEADRMVRPANMEPLEYGQHTVVVKVNGMRVAITNLCGEVWMNNVVDSPFFCMEDILNDIDADIYLVDLHAETTSEKIAFTYQLPDVCRRLWAPTRMFRRQTSVWYTEQRPSPIWGCAVLYQCAGAGCTGNTDTLYNE